MTNLRFYALQDTNTGIVSMFSTSVSDEYAINFYIQQINMIFKGLKSKEQKQKFLQSVHHSKIVRLADIDCAKPSITENLAFLADLNDLVLDDTPKEKKQKEKEN